MLSQTCGPEVSDRLLAPILRAAHTRAVTLKNEEVNWPQLVAAACDAWLGGIVLEAIERHGWSVELPQMQQLRWQASQIRRVNGRILRTLSVAAFELRLSGLKYKDIAELIWRIDGCGPISTALAASFAYRGARALAAPRHKTHPLHLAAQAWLNESGEQSRKRTPPKPATATVRLWTDPRPPYERCHEMYREVQAQMKMFIPAPATRYTSDT